MKIIIKILLLLLISYFILHNHKFNYHHPHKQKQKHKKLLNYSNYLRYRRLYTHYFVLFIF
jgi:hypothetical protein